MNSSFMGYYAHSGFLLGLAQRGIYPGHLSGSSAGAIVAGLHAGGLTAERVAEVCLGAQLHHAFIELGGIFRLPGLLLNCAGVSGLIRGNKAERFFGKLLNGQQIEDCHSPTLSMAVTNLTVGTGEIITCGAIAPFLIASASAPGFFQVQQIDGHQYWDGGITNALPYRQWLNDPNIHTIIQHVIAKDRPQSPTGPSFTSSVRRCHHILVDQLSKQDQEQSKESGKRIIRIETVAPRPSAWSRRLSSACHECGLNSAREMLWTSGQVAF